MYDVCKEAAKGDPEAHKFLFDLHNIITQWDNLVDLDKPADVNGMMWQALVDLPSNPFYASHFHLLQPVLRTAAISWMTANKIEALSPAHAYVLRAMFLDVAVTVAMIRGGLEFAQEVSFSAWLDASRGEPFNEYLETVNGLD